MMDALEQARREIDTVDAQLAALFERRMKVVLSVAEYKKAHGLPVFDAAREKVVLALRVAALGVARTLPGDIIGIMPAPDAVQAAPEPL